MKFNNQKFEDAVRESLAASDLEFTEKNLEFITGIHIAVEQKLVTIDTETGWGKAANTYSVPWQGTSSAYNMTRVNLFLTWDMTKDGDLALFPHIKALHAYDSASTPLEERQIQLHLFPNLKELYLYEVKADNWAHLGNMTSLNMLYLFNCDGDGNEILMYISTSHLDHISMQHMGISDLSFIDWTRWQDVDLSHNEISDITPMENSDIYYLNLSWNKISDIKSLESSCNYYLNLRHNQIENINPLINREREKKDMLRRLLLNYNPIPREQLAKAAQLRLVLNDFTDTYRNVRSDFTYG